MALGLFAASMAIAKLAAMKEYENDDYFYGDYKLGIWA